VFPGAVVDERDRPAFMVNITNDSWFGNSSGPRQHLAAARLRAVEEGMPLVRAANTGISALIDSHGMVVANLGLDRQGVLVADIPGSLPPTVFSRLGLWIPAGFSILSCIAGWAVAIKRGASGFMDKASPKNAKYRPKS
jgi:apolipoprotein N-acyltransferase